MSCIINNKQNNFTPSPKSAGFTIFEVLIYIALFSFIVGGAVISAFQIFAGTAKIDLMAKEETELNFMLRKLNWATSGEIIKPSIGFSDEELEVLVDGDVYRYFIDGTGTFAVAVNNQEEYQLTDLLKISNLTFSRSVGGNPNILTTNISIVGRTINPIIRYVRTN